MSELSPDVASWRDEIERLACTPELPCEQAISAHTAGVSAGLGMDGKHQSALLALWRRTPPNRHAYALIARRFVSQQRSATIRLVLSTKHLRGLKYLAHINI